MGNYPESLKKETEKIKQEVRSGKFTEEKIREIAKSAVEYLRSEEKSHVYCAKVAGAMADNLNEFFKPYLNGE
ncbi:hypothetical protein P4T89_12635 [Bacillus nakamurai]|uniref:Uncharacterized protein n=1 Tax=Bacillus nakamurai TaxID=1793963 RepID=A0A150FAS4_9BACI|nr:hypothetical protein [Bacillus nakamurai]KXZ22411.1 hypothetical protein AXI58_10505 [Bacillus nakamurai]MED1228362.1 hypothetical protein [Bacillus nakamurai]